MTGDWEEAARVFGIEERWLRETLERNRDSFPNAVDILFETTGKIVVCGMGKSGLVGRKIAATMTSTGSPAYFLHPAEGIHGDVGILSRGDSALVLSKSGDTDEIAALLPVLQRLQIPVVAIVTSRDSFLGRFARVVLELPDLREACPYNLAPTASTTAMMALGDALSMAMLRRSGFTPEDFAGVHPGGTLGRKLLMRVRDLMKVEDIPLLSGDTPVTEAVDVMTRHRGICLVPDTVGALAGVFVYGDLGRLMKTRTGVEGLVLSQVMTGTPAVCSPDDPVSVAVRRMEEKGITSIVAVNGERVPQGILYLHDALVLGF